MMMRSFTALHAGDGKGFVVIAPGWVRTALKLCPKARSGVSRLPPPFRSDMSALMVPFGDQKGTW